MTVRPPPAATATALVLAATAAWTTPASHSVEAAAAAAFSPSSGAPSSWSSLHNRKRIGGAKNSAGRNNNNRPPGIYSAPGIPRLQRRFVLSSSSVVTLKSYLDSLSHEDAEEEEERRTTTSDWKEGRASDWEEDEIVAGSSDSLAGLAEAAASSTSSVRAIQREMSSDADVDTDTALAAKFMYTLDFEVEDPILIPGGPVGTRAIFEFIKGSGKVSGPALNGIVVGPSSDYATVRSDGSVALDVKLVIQTDDGATIFQESKGRSQREADNPANSVIRSAATIEAGAEQYQYLNNKMLTGLGTKRGNELKITYYDIP